MNLRTAVVTGASSGIGAATARRLASEGYRVILVARRADRLDKLAAEIGENATPAVLDVTDADAVRAFADSLDDCTLLVNNAGGAIGADYVADANPADWRAMYEVNVLGVLHLTQALLPKLIASGEGTIIILSSTAGHVSYEGGAGYAAAKHGARVLAETLRLELCGEPVRVSEIAPGMVKTDEFAVNRFRGDTDKAATVYAGVDEPLLAEDVADCIAWVATRPAHVDVDLLIVRPRAQAAQHKVFRRTTV